ncbi:MAG: hypothetical protein KKD18_00840 [Nanoarchaeota archaeon]|nr:hypothetical protein [Nanoarchaeota archaeon]MBU0976944.1 hypothetical protein [Nanoarchaeota archaeon]
MAEPFTYGGQTILSHPIFVETILPFLLVFTIVFAILQKSKVLGDGKKQIDAIVSLAIALIVISFAQAVGIILQLIPFLAVSLVILLVLFILLGSFWKIDDAPKGFQYLLVAVITVAVAIAVMYFTNAWQWLLDLLYGGIGESELLTNAIFIIVIAAAVVAVVWQTKSGK